MEFSFLIEKKRKSLYFESSKLSLDCPLFIFLFVKHTSALVHDPAQNIDSPFCTILSMLVLRI